MELTSPQRPFELSIMFVGEVTGLGEKVPVGHKPAVEPSLVVDGIEPIGRLTGAIS